ncbi:translation initiation factor eIF2B gamma subunit [Schizosaccharomyces japonicus yFS275]|uniref:Translation initiation factor eIF2B subunit gamma n=1 Tax=Schizosaccharomyces japonicus (strain yFS275 / FY16936) TaxID=402676 RepID=B6JYJ8_SCHJY|nr:translation initiation factor eIF2B gamma subunit [Schizosaccharomyces japonicus yFS275]EEB06616.2 translation initiation factor eIF2B gamma subunit [Schizosaccharomyces japonicus yFS275]
MSVLYEAVKSPLSNNAANLTASSGGRARSGVFNSIPTEFQAVVFAGYGNSLYPLTGDDVLPKALLPIGNKPMLHYPLQWLEVAGFSSVILVCMEEAQAHINAWLRSGYEGHLRIHVEAPSCANDSLGTADVLRSIAHLIKTDFLCLSCDSITDVPPYQLLDSYRLNNPDALALFSHVPKHEYVTSLTKEIDEKLIVGLEESSSQLLYNKSSADIDSDVSFRMSLLWKHPRITLTTALADTHIYVFRHWVLDLLKENEELSSLRGDLLPLLVKAQNQHSLAERKGVTKFLVDEKENDKPNARNLKVNVFIPEKGACVSLRANNLPNYFEINRIVAKTAPEPKIVDANVSKRAVVGSDCMVNEGTSIGDRSNVKRSVIGRNCTIGNGVVLSNSILMDNIVVGDNVRLESCIVASGVTVGAKSKLRECEIGVNHVVEKGRTARGERLVDMEKIETDIDMD